MALGSIQRIRRYPVKGMRGEDLREAEVGPRGLEGDRAHAFAAPGDAGPFPWITSRQFPEILLYEPRYTGEPGGPVRVRTPEGAERTLPDEAFVRELSERWRRPLALRSSPDGLFDSHPISIFGLASLRALEAEAGLALDPCRFRANFYIEWSDPAPLFEETLLEKDLAVGGAGLRLRIVKKDSRCIVISHEPATAEFDPRVLRTVGRLHRGRIGVYACVLAPGRVRLGDPVDLAV